MNAVKFTSRVKAMIPDLENLNAFELLHQPLEHIAWLLGGGICGGKHIRQGWHSLQRDKVAKQMDADCLLVSGSLPDEPRAASACHILFTGATGFVGSHVLVELLARTDCDIFCVVRCEDAAHGHARLEAILKKLALWPLSTHERIKIVPGSLDLPYFGLSLEQWLELSEQVQSVYHFAAKIAFWDEYHESVSNVQAMANIIRFCTSSTPCKLLQHCSTLSVLGSSSGGTEDTGIGLDAESSSVLSSEGYSQSKWVCEKQVQRAAALHNVPCNIFRLGLIGFNTTTGVMNYSDWFTRLLCGIAAAQSCPPLATAPAISMAAADVTARLLVDLSLLPSDSTAVKSSPRVFHVLSDQPIPLSLFVHALRDRGVAVQEEASHAAWVGRIKESSPLFTLLPWFEAGLPPESGHKDKKSGVLLAQHGKEAVKWPKPSPEALVVMMIPGLPSPD
jgi:thioester reductase-like protein